MTTDLDSTRPSTASDDIEVIGSGFRAVAGGDLAGFAAAFHPDATWNHRNDDRFTGVKAGVDAIVAFLAESMQLTTGTLQPVPEAFLPDGRGQVAVVTSIRGTRPDGRTFDDVQVLLFRVENGLIRSVDQFVGDPAAVTAFWA